ncbi:MAG: hypothetical protein WCK82_15950, partial [Bacteroidota bacterium]
PPMSASIDWFLVRQGGPTTTVSGLQVHGGPLHIPAPPRVGAGRGAGAESERKCVELDPSFLSSLTLRSGPVSVSGCTLDQLVSAKLELQLPGAGQSDGFFRTAGSFENDEVINHTFSNASLYNFLMRMNLIVGRPAKAVGLLILSQKKDIYSMPAPVTNIFLVIGQDNQCFILEPAENEHSFKLGRINDFLAKYQSDKTLSLSVKWYVTKDGLVSRMLEVGSGAGGFAGVGTAAGSERRPVVEFAGAGSGAGGSASGASTVAPTTLFSIRNSRNELAQLTRENFANQNVMPPQDRTAGFFRAFLKFNANLVSQLEAIRCVTFKHKIYFLCSAKGVLSAYEQGQSYRHIKFDDFVENVRVEERGAYQVNAIFGQDAIQKLALDNEGEEVLA